jgi:hypothetical protein
VTVGRTVCPRGVPVDVPTGVADQLRRQGWTDPPTPTTASDDQPDNGEPAPRRRRRKPAPDQPTDEE